MNTRESGRTPTTPPSLATRNGWRAAVVAIVVAGTLFPLYPAFAQPCEPTWDNAIGIPGTNDRVWAMQAFDDGSGAALYVGGGFLVAGEGRANGIARWDGASWSAVGLGVGSPNGYDPGHILALSQFDDGMGSSLYVGGHFEGAGNACASCIARWDRNFAL